MGASENTPAPLATLEDTLVGEFRAYQALVTLTQSERQALLANDLTALLDVVAQKEALHGELDRLEKTRQAAMGQGAQSAGAPTPPLTLAEILPGLEAAAAERLRRLREGILALESQLRELHHGNQALARSALERVEAVRNFLLTINQLPATYQRPGATPAVTVDPALAIEQWA